MLLRRYSFKLQCTTGARAANYTMGARASARGCAVAPFDANPEAMRQRRETIEHPFGTMKVSRGATHILTKTRSKVAAEMDSRFWLMI